MPERANWYKDRHIRAAVLVAPLFWLILYLIDRPVIDISWIVLAPLSFFMLTLIRPIMEEIVFRGLIQGWLISRRFGSRRFLGISYANLGTSLLFTLLHLIAHTPLMALLVFTPSLIFGHLRDRYDGWLIPSIALHCFYNTGYFLLYQPVLSG